MILSDQKEAASKALINAIVDMDIDLVRDLAKGTGFELNAKNTRSFTY